ncbi:MAG: fused MFS/spermidine synthase [Acidobacteriota bacterium]
MLLQFPLTIFLSAFLLFQVQPLMGRYILPWFGGTPAVWSVCLLFFQCILLAGYGYAHWVGSLKSKTTQTTVHLTLLLASLLLLPVAPDAARWKPAGADHPEWRILLLLLATVGGPYFLLSSTTPLLQRWHTLAKGSGAGWRLYALSNFGSFLALFSYPFLMEPYARLRTQSWIWSGLYVGFVAICATTAWKVRSLATETPTEEIAASGEKPAASTVAFWLALAATASTLLLATTNLITQDIAVAPFLWILPLSVYLLSFILTFESDRWYKRLPFAILTGLAVPVAVITASAGVVYLPLWGQAAVYLVALFITCMLCHGELAAARPAARYLTRFYLMVSAGGVAGGVFVALLAPVLFRQFTEYPMALVGTCVLGMVAWFRAGAWAEWTKENFRVRIPLMALLFGALGAIALAVLPSVGRTARDIERNFFGILWVVDRTDQGGDYRQLTHGRIKHGSQYLSGPLHSQPTSYFGPRSGVGVVMHALDQPARNIAIIGLGAGTMAAWGRDGDAMRFYEINPDDEPVARKWFTYLSDSKAKVDVALGDARVVLERELAEGHRNDYDIIVVDAFSSDAIPVHLLTAECADIYRQRLKPDGVLMLHISNLNLNLEPVVRGLAAHLGWTPFHFLSSGYPPAGEDGSNWVLVSPDPQWAKRAKLDTLVSGWTKAPPLLWTDDFSSLWHVLIW